jgi:AmmeMemoRadiSam system protein B
MTTERRIARTALGAGRWFPGNREELKAMVEGFIAEAGPPRVPGRIVSLIAPHAGYVYSGPVAGYAYRAARDNAATAGRPETAVVLGFGHREGFPGVALMDGSSFATPLGAATLDTDAAAQLMDADSRIVLDYRPHMGEHSAENQIPFLQLALPTTALVIGLIGSHEPDLTEALAAALVKLAKKKKVLVIASSDMLHDPDYERVRKIDQDTLRHMVDIDTTGVMEEWEPDQQVFCGLAPVIAAMTFARLQGASKGTVLRYRNSGDDHPEGRGQWVVGYSAVAFTVG